MTISVFALVVSVLLCLTGVYLVFFPVDFKKRLDKSPKASARYLGILSLFAAICVVGSDLRAEASLRIVKSLEKAYDATLAADANELGCEGRGPNTLSTQQEHKEDAQHQSAEADAP